ncbi:HXXEE domain-containing protein [Paenibacillus ihumii]|uniref:HXXEE domain-containing protein n=1 Tax=Paenibacillus ihumii TaxID=687436 RepID=UPI0006D7AD7C|nr:HXXEE domain-containing protein [Paenibacillus ihumii]
MDINFWIWMFLIVFMLHNFEEIFTIEYWFNRIYPVTKERIPLYIIQQMEKSKSMTAGQFTIAVFVLFLVVSVLLIISVTTKFYFLFLGANIFFAINIIIHPIQALFLRRYVPGLWTSVVLILPYNLILFKMLYQEDMLDTSMIILSLIVGALFVPLLLLSHKIADLWKQRFT